MVLDYKIGHVSFTYLGLFIGGDLETEFLKTFG